MNFAFIPVPESRVKQKVRIVRYCKGRTCENIITDLKRRQCFSEMFASTYKSPWLYDSQNQQRDFHSRENPKSRTTALNLVKANYTKNIKRRVLFVCNQVLTLSKVVTSKVKDFNIEYILLHILIFYMIRSLLRNLTKISYTVFLEMQ
jgi:hypothetical protein